MTLFSRMIRQGRNDLLPIVSHEAPLQDQRRFDPTEQSCDCREPVKELLGEPYYKVPHIRVAEAADAEFPVTVCSRD